MFTAIFLEPRFAFVFLCALVIGAAAPLAIAWARLLPDEKPPFNFPRASETEQSADTDSSDGSNAARDPFAIVLLIFVTLSFVWQLPGVPRDSALSQATAFVPDPWVHGLLLFCRGFFVAIPAVAGVYSVFRRHAIRIPLIFAGILVPLLWLAAPWLRAALLSP